MQLTSDGKREPLSFPLRKYLKKLFLCRCRLPAGTGVIVQIYSARAQLPSTMVTLVNSF